MRRLAGARRRFVSLCGGLVALLLPWLAFANGGQIRLAEGTYVVNLSNSPVTPVAGESVAMLISFADVPKNQLLGQDIRVWVEIRVKLNGGVIFPQQEFIAEGGVLPFEFTYPKAGLHELFVRFEKPDEPGKVYETEDFLVDVQEPRARSSRGAPVALLTLTVIGVISSFIAGRLTADARS